MDNDVVERHENRFGIHDGLQIASVESQRVGSGIPSLIFVDLTGMMT